MNNGKKIAIAGCQLTCSYIIESLVDAGYEIAVVICMGEEKAHLISGYVDQRPLARKLGIPTIIPKSYAMKDEETMALFQDMELDVLISAGWQRLFPQWFLDTLSIGAFGMHGSAEQLPRGRGRSPMNWSIIEGRDSFYTNLFRYDAGVDSGHIVGTQKFNITPRDTIRTLQHKNAVAMIHLLLDYLPNILDGTAKYIPQTDTGATYYPKRTPEDGVIDWRETACWVDRLVRAVASPYPGAFTFLNGHRFNIEEGMVFDTLLSFKGEPGQILAVFHDDTFLVQCSDYAYFVSGWSSDCSCLPRIGQRFESRANSGRQKLEKMYENG